MPEDRPWRLFFFPGFLLTFWHKKVGARNPNITLQELGLVLRVFQKSPAKNPSVMGRVQFWCSRFRSKIKNFQGFLLNEIETCSNMACNHSSLRIYNTFQCLANPEKNSETDIQNTPQHFHDFPSAQVTLEAVLSLELGGKIPVWETPEGRVCNL